MGNPIRARDVKPEQVEWLWRERIPRSMLTVVAGRPDQGKGLFCTHVAAELSRRGHQILYSAIEDSPGLMTRPRLEAANANLNNVHVWRFTLPAQMNELVRTVKERNIDLVVMDPFNAHLGQGVNRHSDSIRKVLTPLTDLMERTKLAVIVVEHALKNVPSSGHPLAAIGGNSSGLVAAARMGYVFGLDPKDEDIRMLCWVKGNIRDKPQAIRFETDLVETKVGEMPSLMYESEINFDPMALFQRQGGKGRVAEKRDAAADWLTTYLFLAGEPVLSGRVREDAKQQRITAKTLRMAADAVGILRDPPAGGRTCKWLLPDELVERMKAAESNGHNGNGGSDEPTINEDELRRWIEGNGKPNDDPEGEDEKS